MRSRNTMSVIEYLIETLIDTVITFYLYTKVLFRCLPELGYAETRYLFIGIILSAEILGVWISLRRYRNYMSIFSNIVIPFGAFTILLYRDISFDFIRIIVSLSVVIGLVCGFFRYRNIPDRLRKQVYRVLPYMYHYMSAVVAIGMAVVIVGIGGGSFFSNALFRPSLEATTEYDESQTISANREILNQLRIDKWEELSLEDRLNVLQTVANIEKRYLGLPTELNVGASNIGSNDLMGYYSDATHEIIIDVDLLMYGNPAEILDTICHEAYHAYQYRIIDVYEHASEKDQDLYIFRRAKKYKEEFENYENGSDFWEYYMQYCEADAREYAEISVEDYFEKLGIEYYG